METIFYPLRFTPVYQPYIWGGTRLRERLGRTEPAEGEIVAESWEVSDRDDGMSVVANGPLKGKTLRELMTAHKADLLGAGRAHERFPLLVKVLDAAKTLSVQVHPNDETAARFGGEAKTEMWYVLEADPGAVVYCGLQPGVTPEAFRQAIAGNALEPLMKTIPVKAGDAVFVPGGRVHAIGSGCLLLEVQQNSNTTYRIYDWGRTGNDGKPRELHIDQALEVTLWEDDADALTPAEPMSPLAGMRREKVMQSPYFLLERLEVAEVSTLPADEESFQVLFAVDGAVAVSANGETVTVPRGGSVLLPAAMGVAELTPCDGPLHIIRVTEPAK